MPRTPVALLENQIDELSSELAQVRTNAKWHREEAVRLDKYAELVDDEIAEHQAALNRLR